MTSLFYQIHGYRSGHQLLSGNITLNRFDQDTVDRLSDISGPTRPGELFNPYFTCYPLPSNNYFVLAKTWQDLNSLRAGCVLTKSIFISMAEWESSKDVSNIFGFLYNLTDTLDIVDFNKINEYSLPPCSADTELVEALFLEKRQPIVEFNSSQAEIIIARLYCVFWKNLKTKFSACTFSLSPRTLNGRPFDLLFAPIYVKPKFSDWIGRRIDGSITTPKARHRWSENLAENIFISSNPKLIEVGLNSIIPFDDKSDESILRINLLWNELLIKAASESSPFAILGLLDIINSQNTFESRLYDNLRPYIHNSIIFASGNMQPEDALKFYAALLVKHNRKLMDRSLLFSVKQECQAIAQKHANISLHFIDNYKPFTGTIPSVLFAAVGDGTSNTSGIENLYVVLLELKPTTLFSLIAFSKKFAKRVIKVMVENEVLFESFKTGYRNAEKRIFNKGLKNIISSVDPSHEKFLLEYMLQNADNDIYKSLIVSLADNLLLTSLEFRDIIIEGTIRLSQFEFLKEVVTKQETFENVNSLILSIILVQPSQLEWLISTNALNDITKKEVIEKICENITFPFSSIQHLDDASVAYLYELAMQSKNNILLYYIVSYGNLPSEVVFNNLQKFSNEKLRNIPAPQIERIIVRGLIGGSILIQESVKALLPKLIAVNPIKIVREIVKLAISTEKKARSIKVILLFPQWIDVFRKNLFFVNEVIFEIFKNNFEADIEIFWVKLLKSADYEGRNKTAALMVDFSYKCKNYDPTGLLFEGFPIVYNQLSNGNPVMQMLPFLFFSDWDKSRTLRNKLVQSYTESNWSRIGLFEVAFKANIEKEVMSILIDMDGGIAFMKQAYVQGKQHNSQNHPIMKMLLKFLKNKR